MSSADEYNKVNTVNMTSLEYAKYVPNRFDKNLHCVCIGDI